MSPTTDSAAQPEWTLYRSRISYFSGKLEAYLQYKDIPFRRVDVDLKLFRKIKRHTGVMKMPAMEHVSGEWLFDTTPTIAWLEARYGGTTVLPPDPALAFVALLIEDYGDEWLWRPAMWWRWVPIRSRRLLGSIIASEIISKTLERPLGWGFGRRQLWEWVYGDGVGKGNTDQVRDMYYRELEFLEAQLRDRPFILGSHPSMADFGYFGSMFRHFNNDPESGEVMRIRAPRTNEWVARLWGARQSELKETPDWMWPSGAHWNPLLNRIANDYLPYLRQNAAAHSAGKRRFDYVGDTIRFPHTKTTHYRVLCLEVLQRHYRALDEEAKAKIDDLFGSVGDLRILDTSPAIDTGMADRYRLPVARGEERGASLNPLVLLLGQPRN